MKEKVTAPVEPPPPLGIPFALTSTQSSTKMHMHARARTHKVQNSAADGIENAETPKTEGLSEENHADIHLLSLQLIGRGAGISSYC